MDQLTGKTKSSGRGAAFCAVAGGALFVVAIVWAIYALAAKRVQYQFLAASVVLGMIGVVLLAEAVGRDRDARSTTT